MVIIEQSVTISHYWLFTIEWCIMNSRCFVKYISNADRWSCKLSTSKFEVQIDLLSSTESLLSTKSNCLNPIRAELPANWWWSNCSLKSLGSWSTWSSINLVVRNFWIKGEVHFPFSCVWRIREDYQHFIRQSNGLNSMDPFIAFKRLF